MAGHERFVETICALILVAGPIWCCIGSCNQKTKPATKYTDITKECEAYYIKHPKELSNVRDGFILKNDYELATVSGSTIISGFITRGVSTNNIGDGVFQSSDYSFGECKCRIHLIFKDSCHDDSYDLYKGDKGSTSISCDGNEYWRVHYSDYPDGFYQQEIDQRWKFATIYNVESAGAEMTNRLEEQTTQHPEMWHTTVVDSADNRCCNGNDLR